MRELGDAGIVIADGFSCREQIEQLTDRRALHLAEVLQLAMYRRDLPREERPEVQVIAHLPPPELAPATMPAGRAAFAVAGTVAAGGAAWWLLGG